MDLIETIKKEGDLLEIFLRKWGPME